MAMEAATAEAVTAGLRSAILPPSPGAELVEPQRAEPVRRLSHQTRRQLAATEERAAGGRRDLGHGWWSEYVRCASRRTTRAVGVACSHAALRRAQGCSWDDARGGA